jgi:hypothetical protein
MFLDRAHQERRHKNTDLAVADTTASNIVADRAKFEGPGHSEIPIFSPLVYHGDKIDLTVKPGRL